MTKSSAIVVTGAAGFIGSCLTGFLNHKGYNNLILVDEFNRVDKVNNLKNKKYSQKIERDDFFQWLENNKPEIDFVFHLGARTDTTEFDYAVHERLNLEYSQHIWDYCMIKQIPLVYASSAATYGSGQLGYNDDHELPFRLEPLNAYGISKNEFDKWAILQQSSPPFWAGLKFFNVYGPNEYHKGRMASVIWHSFNQINQTGTVKLFKSHRPDFEDGQQLRDFIYVKDILKVCFWFMEKYKKVPESGLFNLGTGKARSFEDLVKATFSGLGKDVKIQYIDMPRDIRDKYQYFTEAQMKKLIRSGYTESFYSLEAGISDYVQEYLLSNNYF
ncbi:MAG TPA: ADP-glyceromanno-heptose 6-epimerase [Puia sp.]|jgi:ADP-L-glycero-D-manno-heptose 6-epimerase|nr:ADP-glyceromanno-heptose 6-epimerase [Puia sp.]